MAVPVFITHTHTSTLIPKYNRHHCLKAVRFQFNKSSKLGGQINKHTLKSREISRAYLPEPIYKLLWVNGEFVSPSSLISGCFSTKVKTYHNVHISELTAAQLEYFCLSFYWKELKASMQKVFIILFLPVYFQNDTTTIT